MSGGCLFITCCVMTSVTHHLPFLGRVIDQPVFQHVNKMIPTCSTSCKILSRLSSMAMTSSAPNTGRGATGVFFFFFFFCLCACVCFDAGATSYGVFMKWRHTPFKGMSSLCLYEVTKCTVATRQEAYSNCNCGKDCQPFESRVGVERATSYSIFIPRHVS